MACNRISTAAFQLLMLCLVAPFTDAALVSYSDTCRQLDGMRDQMQAYTTFASNITNDGPLMLTIESWTDDEASSPGTLDLHRSFYLSTPPTLNLSEVQNFLGCGIVLFNVTSALQVEQNFSDYNSFSCDTVMNSQCQDDIRQQALDQLQIALNETESDGTRTFTCLSLAHRLSEQAVPTSCNLGSKQPVWRDSTGAFIAGRNAIEPWGSMNGPGESCTVNNETAHNDLYVQEYYAILPHESEEVKSFQNGTTPFLTMFFNDRSQPEHASFLPQPEIHLTCIKTIPTAEEQAKINFGTRLRTDLLILLLPFSLLIVTFF